MDIFLSPEEQLVIRTRLKLRPADPTEQTAVYLHRKPRILRQRSISTEPLHAMRCDVRWLRLFNRVRTALDAKKQGAFA